MALEIEKSLQLLGTLLAGRNQHYRIVIVGGAALILRGVVDRQTQDVDIIAYWTEEQGRRQLLPAGDPIPEPLQDVALVVAGELGLASDWLNAVVGSQWRTVPPPDGMVERCEWRRYEGLEVGIAGRLDLIAFKLFATVDRPEHLADLLALAPNDEELSFAVEWVARQDASQTFADGLVTVVEHVRRHR